jgi:phosphoribosyl-ATP pyrophosphohydrolase
MFLEMIIELRNDLNEKLICSNNEDGINIKSQIKTIDKIISLYKMIDKPYISKLRFVKSEELISKISLEKQIQKIGEENIEFVDAILENDKDKINEELQDLIQACIHFYHILNYNDLGPNDLHIEKMEEKFNLGE